MNQLNLIWMQGQTCDGDSMAVIDATNPDFLTFLERYNINLIYHPTLSPAFGGDAQKIFDDCLSGKQRIDIFVFEGAVPTKPGFGDYFGGKDVKTMVKNFASKAMITVAAGTCASFGGVPSAAPNESGAVGLQFSGRKKGGLLGEDYFSGIGFPVINIPGCPTHPDWVINTLLSFRIGRPVLLDNFNRPKDYFGEKVHRGCKFCEFHERGLWAKDFGELGCMAAALGCKGRTTSSDCNIRLWNGMSSCPRSGAPCIGCCDPGFPESMLPFNKETLDLPDDILEELKERKSRLAQAQKEGRVILMTTKHTIDPINRIEGDLAVEITVGNDNRIEDAKSAGFVYRGFENIFIGRRPFDAMRMSQRVCGVCPISHGTAGAKAIEDAIGFKIPRNAELIRQIVMGANCIVSHLTHFYFMWGADLVNEAYKNSKLYPELKKRFNPLKSEHLKTILKEARIPLHSIVAIYGGKIPHPHHAVPGGVCCVPKHIEIIHTSVLLNGVKEFVEKEILNGMILEEWFNVKSAKDLQVVLTNENFANSDIGVFIRAGLELGLHKLGEGTPNNFLSFGMGVNKEGWLFKPGYLEAGKFYELDPAHISEDTAHSFYENETKWRHPSEGITKPALEKQGAYSWIKAARYFGHVAEAGPLARQLVNGDPLITDLVKTYGVNTFTRTVARLHESLLLIPALLDWVDEIDLTKPFYYPFPSEIKKGGGAGLVEAPRGALGHWINIENSLCTSYQIITPTTWNCSPEDSNGKKSAVEQALIGVKLKNKDSILEAGHIVRSFDPCISCSIHSVGQKKSRIVIDPTR